MLKLLHIGIDVKPVPIWISKALKAVTDYKEILPHAPANLIRQLYDSHKPDCVFMQIQSPGFNIGLVEYMSKNSIVINWSGDVRDPFPQWYRDFNKYCVTCFSNMRDVREVGGEFIQIGTDPDIFKKWEAIDTGGDIVFMANYSPRFPLSEYRLHMVNFLKATYGKRFKMIGNNFPHTDGNLMNNQIGESQFYSGSKIAISLSHYNLERYFSDRLIRAMGSGCFTLSHYYEGISKDFQVCEHLDVFRDFEELKFKIDYYLSHEAERDRIADNGYEYVHKNFTSHKMAQDILKIYEKYKNGKKVKPVSKLVHSPGQATAI